MIFKLLVPSKPMAGKQLNRTAHCRHVYTDIVCLKGLFTGVGKYLQKALSVSQVLKCGNLIQGNTWKQEKL